MLAIKMKVWFRNTYSKKAGGDGEFRRRNVLRWAFSGMAWMNMQLGHEAACDLMLAFVRHQLARFQRRGSLLKGGARVVCLKALLSSAIQQSKHRFTSLNELKEGEYYNLLKVYTRLQRQKARKKYASKNLAILENLNIRGPVMMKYLKLYTAKLKCDFLLDYHVNTYTSM